MPELRSSLGIFGEGHDKLLLGGFAAQVVRPVPDFAKSETTMAKDCQTWSIFQRVNLAWPGSVKFLRFNGSSLLE
jgi:hypothetical protein